MSEKKYQQEENTSNNSNPTNPNIPIKVEDLFDTQDNNNNNNGSLDSSYYEDEQNPLTIKDDYGQNKYQKKYTSLRIIKVIISFAVLIFVYIFFVEIMGHECPIDEYPTEDDCMQFLVDEIFVWAVIIAINSILLNVIYQLASNGYIEKFFKYVALGLALYLGFFKYNISLAEVSVREQAGGHALFLIAMTGGIAAAIQIVYGCTGLYRLSRTVFAALYFILFCGFVFFYIEADKSCDGWEKGLTGEIIMGEEYCHIEKPWVCWPVVVNNLLNFGTETCDLTEFQSKNMKDDVFEKFGWYLNKSESEKQKMRDEIQYIAWPMFQHFSYNDRKYDLIQNLFTERCEVVDSPEAGFKDSNGVNRETVLDLVNNQLLIHVERNQTIVDNAKNVIDNSAVQIESMSDNIIIVYIDTLSRAQTHRKMPKSMEYLQQYTVKEKEKEVFEFYRFHSIDKKTNNNMFKMQFDYLYDEVYESLEKDDGIFSEDDKKPNLINEFRNAGYITAHIQNTCTSQCLFREKYVPIQKYFGEDPPDHEWTIWDPLYINPDNYYDLGVGPSAITRRCLYGKDTSDYMMDYAEQFMDAYKDEKKAVFMEFTDAHEITSEIIQYMDDHLYNFLNKVNKHTDENTIVYFISDHGQHLVQSFYLQENKVLDTSKQFDNFMQNSTPSKDLYQIERILPLMIMMVSADVMAKYPTEMQNIKENEQIAFGMPELRNTLLANAFGMQDDRFKEDLFNEKDKTTSCIEIGQVKTLDPIQYCVCRPYNWRDL